MRIEFPYGKGELGLEIPEENLIDVLEREKIEGLEDERESILESLRDPIGCPSLQEMVGKGDEVAIITTDNTRPCPDDRLVRPLLEELENGGVNKEDISIVVGYGLHEPLDTEGLEGLLGEDVVENYEIVNHDYHETVHLGETSRNIPIEVNETVMEADFRIATGLIEPHFFAGYSGGRKSIMPAVSSRRAIYGNHGYEMISDANSRPGVLEGNPIYEDSVEHAMEADLNFILNVLLNKEGEVIEVVAGDFIDAHNKGVESERTIVSGETDHRADIVFTTNSGAPLDLNLYQTVKGIFHASLVTKEGGIIIAAAECGEGLGPDEFVDLHRRSGSPEEILRIIREEEPIGVQWENQILAQLQKKFDVYLKSELEDEKVEGMGIRPISSLEEGLGKAFDQLGSDAEVVTMAEGPMLIPETSK